MSKYVANFEFGGELDPEEVQGWFEAITQELPEGTSGTVKRMPLILDIADVTQEHAGNKITIRGYHKKVKDKNPLNKGPIASILNTENLTGILEHVFITGGHQDRRTFIIDGAAYDIPAYSLVELGEW